MGTGATAVASVQALAQRLAGWGHNRGVEGVADRQIDYVVAGLQEEFRGLLDRPAGSPDYRLRVAVDIGDDDIAVHRLQNTFHFVERGDYCSHPARVVHGNPGHAAAAGADGLQCVLELSAPEATRAPYSPRLWPIVMSG